MALLLTRHTLPFIPDNVADWKLVPGEGQIVPKADGRASIRLEGIDALETHYGEKKHVEHQPRGLAHEAADELLKFLGFNTVLRDDDETVATTPDIVPGWILTRGADAFGRCVAFVGKGTPPVYSGHWTGVDDDLGLAPRLPQTDGNRLRRPSRPRSLSASGLTRQRADVHVHCCPSAGCLWRR